MNYPNLILRPIGLRKPGLVLVLLFLSELLLVSSLYAQNTGSISGTILEKSTQQPLRGATISIAGTSLSTLADSAGRFRITGIPVKTYNINVTAIGFKTFTLYNVIVNSGNENSYSFELESEASTLSEVVVKGSRRTARASTLETPLSVQRLTTEEIKSNPGGNFDISKVIQSLPGVGGGPQGGSFRNDINIREVLQMKMCFT